MGYDFYWVGGHSVEVTAGLLRYPWDVPANWVNHEGSPFGSAYPGSDGRTDDRVFFVNPAPGDTPMVSACDWGPAQVVTIASVYEDGSSNFSIDDEQFYVWGTVISWYFSAQYGVGYNGSVTVTAYIEVGSHGGVNHHEAVPVPLVILRDSAVMTDSPVDEILAFDDARIGDPFLLDAIGNDLNRGEFHGNSCVTGGTYFEYGPFLWNSTGDIRDTESDVRFLSYGAGTTIRLMKHLFCNVTGGRLLVEILRREATLTSYGTSQTTADATRAYGFRPRGGRAFGV